MTRAEIQGESAAAIITHLAASGAIDEAGISRECVHLEITGRTAMANADLTQSRIDELKDAGILIALDDFGTGYSSMAYLHKFKPSYIKIDRSFIANAADAGPGDTILRSLVDMIHGVGAVAIAEGIETEEQQQMLSNLKCRYAQGYLFSRLIDVDRLGEVLTPGCTSEAPKRSSSR